MTAGDPSTAAAHDFEPPTFGAPVSLDDHLALCPGDATTLGTFFQYVQESLSGRSAEDVESAFEGQPVQRWVAFKQYPLRDFMRLAFNTARIVHAGVPRGEGLRRIGWMSYPSFAATMAGRVVLYAFGDKLEQIFSAAPKSYRLALPCARLTGRSLGDHHQRLEMRDVYSFAETLHCGVLEGAIKTHGFEPDIRIRRGARLCDVDFDIRWSSHRP